MDTRFHLILDLDKADLSSVGAKPVLIIPRFAPPEDRVHSFFLPYFLPIPHYGDFHPESSERDHGKRPRRFLTPLLGETLHFHLQLLQKKRSNMG